MKYLIAILILLFATYADIFLYRINIIPFQPSSFLIPLFLVFCGLKYSINSYLDIFKSHSFKLLFAIMVFSMVFSAFSSAETSVIKTDITLSVISVLLYVFSMHFFRTEDKKLVFLVIFLSFLTLAGSVCYDFLFGLPKYDIKLADAVRKGGFGENPNQAASGIKFLALAVLVFLWKFKVKKYLLISAMLISVFLTFSRSGIISVIIILIFGTANNWNKKCTISMPVLFKSLFKMAFLFTSLYLGLVLFAGVIKENFPSFTSGAAGDRIDLLTGQGKEGVIAEDVGKGGGRGDLLIMYVDKFMEKPFGHGTGYTSDRRFAPLNTHNYYLFLAVNYGFLALILYLIYLWTSLKLAFKQDEFYYLIFIALIFFEGFISHSIYYERSLLITLAFFDSLLYKKKQVESNEL